jgi:uncharacterized protein
LVENWAKARFDNVVTVDLELERDLHSLFSLGDPMRFVEELSLLKGRRLEPGKCLLFLDEIQACPKAIAQLRYFYERIPGLHVIAAGSLLDFALGESQHSTPVGRVEFLHLHPMSFEEFLDATEGPALVDYLGRVTVDRPPSDAVDLKLTDALRRYFFVGGMPEAVRAYAAGRDLLKVRRIQAGLVETMEADFAKYGPARLRDLMRKTYRHAAQNVGRKIKYANISRDDRSAEVRRAMEWLTMSRVVHPVIHTSANGLPLGAEADERHFKALFLDIGLVNRLCGLDLVDSGDLVTVHEGGLAEQFVGQQLLAAAPAWETPQLYYWIREARSSNAEVDFLVSRAREIVPVEVKAGKAGTLRSAWQFLGEKNRRLALRFHAGPFAFEQLNMPGAPSDHVQLLSLPLYACAQWERLLAAVAHDPSHTTTTPTP